MRTDNRVLLQQLVDQIELVEVKVDVLWVVGAALHARWNLLPIVAFNEHLLLDLVSRLVLNLDLVHDMVFNLIIALLVRPPA